MRDDETVHLRPDPAERELMRGDWIRSGWPDNTPTLSDVDGPPVHVADLDRLASTWVRDPFEGRQE